MVKQLKHDKLWFKILESQIETGTPYLCFKDASNNKSNQQSWEQSNQVIFAQKLLNIVLQQNMQYAIWLQ